MDAQDSAALRQELIRSLQDIYSLEAFGALADLLQGEALVLRYLLEHRSETVYPSVLSQRLRLSRSRITGALNSLRKKGFLTTEPTPRDRRMLQVVLTDTGAARIAGQLSAMTAYFDRMLSGLGDGDSRELIRLIDRCVQIMEA